MPILASPYHMYAGDIAAFIIRVLNTWKLAIHLGLQYIDLLPYLTSLHPINYSSVHLVHRVVTRLYLVDNPFSINIA